MKILLLILSLFIIVACGSEPNQQDKSCSIKNDKLICPDGTSTIIPKNGTNGTNGKNGNDGKNGKDGANGTNGKDGVNGKDGFAIHNKGFDLYKKYRSSVFRLDIFDTINASQPSSFGTGWLCATNKICSNRHVLGDMNDVNKKAVKVGIAQLHTTDDILHEYVLVDTSPNIKVHQTKDLAVLILDQNLDLTVLPIDLSETTKSPITTTPTFSMGFDLGLEELHTSFGDVKSNSTITLNDYTTSNDTAKGASGSPLFNLLTGKVIGMVTAGPGPTDTSANWTWVAASYHLNNIL